MQTIAVSPKFNKNLNFKVIFEIENIDFKSIIHKGLFVQINEIDQMKIHRVLKITSEF